MTWALLTGEYPPQPGGVSDYTRLVASGLAKCGEEVHVWAPATAGPECDDPGVVVHRLPGHFGPQALRLLDEDLNHLPSPRRVLVEYVPHAFGWRAMNVPFCMWLGARRRESIWSMFHEVAFPLDWHQPPSHNLLAVVTGYMAKMVARASERIFYSTTAWLPQLEHFAGRAEKTWLPVPSNVSETVEPPAVAAVRTEIAKSTGSRVAGHFGTYSPQSQELLLDVFSTVLDSQTDTTALFAGRGSNVFRDRFIGRRPSQAHRVRAIETTCPNTISSHLAACDVLVQPYPDGVTTRRASLMASLALGKAIVTNHGRLTEALWERSGAVQLIPELTPQPIASAVRELLASEGRRQQLGVRAAALYSESFALSHTLKALAS